MSFIFSDCFANVNSGSSTKLKVKHWSANEKKWQSRTLALWQRTLTHSHKRTQPLHRRGRTNEPKHLGGQSTRWRSNPRLKTERIEMSQRKIPKIVLSILKGPWWEWSKKPPKCQPRCSATLPNGPGQVVPYITTTPKNQFWERKCLRSKSSKRWTQQPRECTNTRWSSGSKVC